MIKNEPTPFVTQAKSRTVPDGFKRLAIEQWSRLHPNYLQTGGGVRTVLVIGFREGSSAYFAPIRMLFWLGSYAARSAWTLIKGLFGKVD